MNAARVTTVDTTAIQAIAAVVTELEAEVAATSIAMTKWDRQHGWLHSPEERAADRSEAEQELS